MRMLDAPARKNWPDALLIHWLGAATTACPKTLRPNMDTCAGSAKSRARSFALKPAANLGSKENDTVTCQQDPSPAHASTIASSQSIEQGETSSLDSPMGHRSETLQPLLYVPETAIIPRDASNAALELPSSTTALIPASSENRHQYEVVGGRKASRSYAPEPPFFCTAKNHRLEKNNPLEFSTFADFRLHLETINNASVIIFVEQPIYEFREIILHNVKTTELIMLYCQTVQCRYGRREVLAARRLLCRIRENVGSIQASRN